MVEDENGNIVRETMKDNDVLAQYKSMRETLVYLCHLDYDDTEHQMLDKLRLQVGAAPPAGAHGTVHGLTTPPPVKDRAAGARALSHDARGRCAAAG